MRISTTIRHFASLLVASLLALPALAGGHKPAQTIVGQRVVKSAPSPAMGPLAIVTRPAAAEAPAAPQTVTVTGVVLLADGQPCPGACVYASNTPRQLVVTDARGAFALPVPAGTPVAIKADYFGVGSTRLALDKASTQPLRLMLGR